METRGNQLAPPTPSTDVSNTPTSERRDTDEIDPSLELRLMHGWTAYACKTFATDVEFWMYQVPLIALQFRPVLDSVLAMAALHASRQPPKQWVPTEGRMVPLRDVTYDPAHPYQDVNNTGKPRSMEINEAFLNRVNHAGNNVYLASKRRSEMLAASRFYFERAIDGYMRSLQDLSIENIEAIFVTSVLCSFHACFVLSESDEDSTLPSVDPVQWMRIGKGTRFIRHRWADLVGSVWLGTSGVLNGKPGIMMDDPTLFNTEHGRPFLKLLTYAQDFETIHAEDRAIYKDVLCYIGAIYTMIVEHTEDEVAMCRRIVGTASWNDPSFTDFVEARQPRALAILAHLFACMKLIAEKVPWFDGIAERQIPKIYDQLPAGWRPMLAWPIAIMNGEIDREPTETQIDDILAL